MVPVTRAGSAPASAAAPREPARQGDPELAVPPTAERLARRPRVRRARDRTEVRDPAAVRGDERRAARGACGRTGQEAVVAILRRAAPRCLAPSRAEARRR